MAPSAQQHEGAHSLEVRRTIRAPRERVFRAWTRQEEIDQWGAPGPMSVPRAQVDLRVGGSYRIEMLEPDGTRHVATGVYKEVKPPERVVFTWGWDDKSDATDTLVTVEFHERGRDTEVVLKHERFDVADHATRHQSGWTSILEKFAQRF